MVYKCGIRRIMTHDVRTLYQVKVPPTVKRQEQHGHCEEILPILRRCSEGGYPFLIE